MKHPDPSLTMPLYVKSADNMPWPADEKAFYLLSRDDLFLCRNNRWFSSSVPAPAFPSGLAEQRTFCRLHYPKLPRRLLEVAVGFFDRVHALYGSESALLLARDEQAERYRLICPKQTATVGYSSYDGSNYPIGLKYEVNAEIPPHWSVLGDLHCHGQESSYSSSVDRDDERHRPGLHIVVGQIHCEPPQFHVDFVVDGMRFKVEQSLVLEGYEKRRLTVPREWIDSVQVECRRPRYYSSNY